MNSDEPSDPPNQSGGYEPIPNHLLIDWTNRLKSGEEGNAAHGIAKYMLEAFCIAVALQKQPPPILLEWIADVIERILEKGKPEARRAFSLLPNRPGGKGQTWKHIRIAQWIYITIKRGYLEPQAIKDAAALFHQDEKTIRRAWKQCSKGDGWNFADDDATSETFKQMNRPLPQSVGRGTTKK
jgi:hypothetical protein